MVYTISNRNDNNVYVKDTGSDILSMGALDRTAYWRFIPTGNSNYVYIQNVATGRYVQECSTASDVNVKMGTKPVEYTVVLETVEGTDCYGITSTNQPNLNFTAGALGWNWKNDNTVQTFAAVAGTNHRSFWKLTSVYSKYLGSVPAAGSYYLYNVNTGKWLGDNYTNTDGSWSSHGELGARGRDIELVVSGDGFRLNPKLGNNHSINANNLYMDTGAAQTTWTFTPVAGGLNTYKITSGTYTLGGNASGNLTSVTADVVADTWQLVSKAERINRDMAVATETAPSDMSWAVLGGTFPVADEHRSNGTWQGNFGDNASGGDGFYHCNRVWEMWNITNKDVFQVVNVPNGKYQIDANAIYVSSANDKMSAAHYDAFLNGTEPTLGSVYANDQSVPMVNVYSLVTDARVNDRNTKDLGNGKWAYNGTNEYSTNIFEGKGKTEKINLNITDGTLKVGVKVEGATSSWILFDNIGVTYLGPLTGTAAYIGDLNKAIANGEANTTPTTVALKNALNQAVADGKTKLTSENTDEISAATAAINLALTNISACAANYDMLNRIVTACETQNTKANNPTLAAAIGDSKAVLVSGLTNTELTTSLTKLRITRRIQMGGNHDYSSVPSVEPADGVEAYIYNVGAGLYLAGGNDWGTHASLNYASRSMVLVANTSKANCFDIRTNLPNGIRGVNDWLGHNGYVDCGGHTANQVNWGWVFEPVGDGSYRIINAQNTGTNIYFGMTEDARLQVDTDKSGPDNPYNHWKLITKAQLDVLMAQATPEVPADATYYIHQSTFSQNDFDGNDKAAANADLNDSPWEPTVGSIWNWKQNNAGGDYIFEMWNTGEQTAGPVTLTQALTGMKPGKYVVSATGFYRDGNFDNAVAVADYPEKWAYLTANTESTLFPAITDEANMLPGEGRTSGDGLLTFPDGGYAAAKYFQAGLYRTELPVTVGADGMLTIGVSKERTTPITTEDWVVVDNFRLTYFGPTSTQVTVGPALYATYVAPYNLDFTGNTVKAYSAQVQTYGVHLEPATAIKKGEPVVLYAPTEGTYDVSVATAEPSALVGNELVYSPTDVVADGTQYVLAMPTDNPVGFYQAETTSTIFANKAYLVISSGAAKAFYPIINADDETTGINSIDLVDLNKAKIYNLQGQKIASPVKGVNIINGQKVVIK